MALTELQLPTKAEFYNQLQSAASQMNAVMHNWADLAEFISRMGTADLDAIGVATGQVRTDLIDLRTVLEEMVNAFNNGGTIVFSEIPASIVDKIRRM